MPDLPVRLTKPQSSWERVPGLPGPPGPRRFAQSGFAGLVQVWPPCLPTNSASRVGVKPPLPACSLETRAGVQIIASSWAGPQAPSSKGCG